MPKIVKEKPVAVKKAKRSPKEKGASVVKKTDKKGVASKTVKPVSSQKETPSKIVLSVLSSKGEKAGTISVPAELFGASYNAQLVSQAVRVYEMNQREGSAATKTRGMVEGSTRKIYRQKGTGRARHGGIRAPIFVGGGITFGPVPRTIHKTLSKQMKKKALACTLSLKRENNQLFIIDGVDELPVKTKSYAQMLKHMNVSGRTLVVYGKQTSSASRALRNISTVSVFPFDSFTSYDVMTHASLVFTKDALLSFIEKGAQV